MLNNKELVNPGELTVLPAANTEQISHDIALLFAIKFGHVLIRAHDDCKQNNYSISNHKWKLKRYKVETNENKIYGTEMMVYLPQLSGNETEREMLKVDICEV